MIAALRRGLRGRRGLAIVLGVALLARLVRWGLDFPIWGDEAFVGCSLLARDLSGLLAPLEFEMVVPLGWLLPTGWLAQRFDGATLALRLPALLAGIAALLLFARLARRMAGPALSPATALLSVAWFGASYYLIRHGAEVKPYAFDLLAGVLLYGAALRLAASRRTPPAGADAAHERTAADSARGWLAFAAIGVIAVWCSYPAIFVAVGAGGAAALLQVRRKPAALRLAALPLSAHRRIVPALLALAAVAISFAAMYLRFGHAQQWSEERIADARHWDDHFLPLGEPWRWPLWLLRELTGNLLAYPNGGPNFGSSATFLLCVAGGVAWWRRGRRAELLVLLAPLLPMLAASALRKYPFGGSARIALHLAIPICLLAASGVAAVAAAVRRRASATTVATALLLLFALGSPIRDCLKPWKTEQDRRSREAFEWFAAQLAPGDVIAVFGHFGGDDGGDGNGNGEPPAEFAGGAPDLRGWRGSSGRLRFHLLRLTRSRDVSLRFAPVASALARAFDTASDSAASPALWTVTYRDNEAPFPEAAHSGWQAALEAALHRPLVAARESTLGRASPDPTTGAARAESITFARAAR